MGTVNGMESTSRNGSAAKQQEIERTSRVTLECGDEAQPTQCQSFGVPFDVMSSLFALLPPPRFTSFEKAEHASHQKSSSRSSQIPPYPTRTTTTPAFTPTMQSDFGDGGAFPEIHVSQYPLNMGRPGSSSALTLHVDASSGSDNITNAIVRSGQRDNKLIYGTMGSVLSLGDDLSFVKPDVDEQTKLAQETQRAISKRINRKIAIAHNLRATTTPKTVSLPNTGPATATGSSQYYRIHSFDDSRTEKLIQIEDEEVDPLDPPKFRSKRLHRAPPSPPVPIVHSPKRKKLTASERKKWTIPPCISNWKNPKGFTIPLDKRLAVDGRGLKQVKISERFGDLSEALYVAEQTAREELDKRAQLQEAVVLKRREEKEKRLRELAMKAREQKMKEREVEAQAEAEAKRGADRERGPPRGTAVRETRRPPEGIPGNTRGDTRHVRDSQEVIDGLRQRERVRERMRRDMIDEEREERRTQRARRRSSRGNPSRERDITEKIALGIAPKTAPADQVDSRLYERAGSGLGVGFADSDSYRVFDRPFRNIQSQIYHVDEQRMKQNAGDVSEYTHGAKDRFELERGRRGGDGGGERGRGRGTGTGLGFEGGDEGDDSRRRGGQSGPVMFERDGGLRYADRRRGEDEEEEDGDGSESRNRPSQTRRRKRRSLSLSGDEGDHDRDRGRGEGLTGRKRGRSRSSSPEERSKRRRRR